MPFGGFHWYELIPLVLIALLIFGPKKLPELGSSIGKTIREFQKSMREVTNPTPPSTTLPSLTAPQEDSIPATTAPTSVPSSQSGAPRPAAQQIGEEPKV